MTVFVSECSNKSLSRWRGGALAAEVVNSGGVHEVGAPAHAVAQVVRQHLRVVLQDLPVDQIPNL